MSDKLFNDVKAVDWNLVSRLPNGKEMYSLFVQNYSKWDTALEQLNARINMNFGIDEAIKKLEKNVKVIFCLYMEK